MTTDGNRSQGVPPIQPQPSAPARAPGFNAAATPTTATGLRAVRAPVRSPRPRRRGPKTPAGKARVAGNAVTHGLTSTRPVVPGERREDWAAHCRQMLDDMAPVGPLETALAKRAASALWRLERVIAYEEAAIAERQKLETESARLLPHPLDIDKIIRYEAHLSRQFYQAYHELEAMQAARRGQAAPLLRVDVHGTPDRIAAVEAPTA